MNISLVIPVYNGSLTISDVVKTSIKEFEDLFQLEIILVNDFSHDSSHEICLSLQKSYPSIITYINLTKNFGEHNAVMAGLHYAKGDFVTTLDDDGQNPPLEALKLTQHAISNKLDVVYSSYRVKKHHFIRNFFSWFNDRVATIMLKKPPNLYLSSFRTMSAFVVSEIIKYDLPFPYVDGLILRTTSNIGVLETEHLERDSGVSGYSFRKLFRLWLNMFTNFSILPLRVASLFGFIFALIGILIGFYTIYEKLHDPSLPVGWATLSVLCSILGGVQLMALGMIGEYLGRLFLGTNKQPQFVIRDSYSRHKS